MKLLELEDMESRELAPGYHGRFVHTGNVTLSYVQVDAEAELTEHFHPHEQIVNIIDGEFDLMVDGEKINLKRGRIVVIPPNVPHSGKAISDCLILDVFHPVREDFK